MMLDLLLWFKDSWNIFINSDLDTSIWLNISLHWMTNLNIFCFWLFLFLYLSLSLRRIQWIGYVIVPIDTVNILVDNLRMNTMNTSVYIYFLILSDLRYTGLIGGLLLLLTYLWLDKVLGLHLVLLHFLQLICNHIQTLVNIFAYIDWLRFFMTVLLEVLFALVAV